MRYILIKQIISVIILLFSLQIGFSQIKKTDNKRPKKSTDISSWAKKRKEEKKQMAVMA
jgi:hypothetical protein